MKTFRAGRREVRALDGVRIHSREGEFVSLPGPSGYGESTILRILAGLESQSSGEVLVRQRAGHGRTGSSTTPSRVLASSAGPVRTAPRYRFYSFHDRFPGLLPAREGGWPVPGEIYEISYGDLRWKLLPGNRSRWNSPPSSGRTATARSVWAAVGPQPPDSESTR